MPPHCDTLDGPVVSAALQALESGDVNVILPWVPEDAEDEVKSAFKAASRVRKLGDEGARLADRWFFETVVRLHRLGEGASYAGLKPAGLDVGPVLPRAEAAIATGDAHDVIAFLSQELAEELPRRLARVRETRSYHRADVAAARAHVRAVLDFELFAHHLHEQIKSGQGHEAPARVEREVAHAHA